MKILALNPRPKKKAPAKKKRKPAKKKTTKKKITRRAPAKKKPTRKPAKKKGSTMAKRKSTPKKRRGPAKRGPGRSKRRTYTKNPSARGILEDTGIPKALQSLAPMLGGAMVAKVIQKRLGDGTDEGDTWTWKDYGMGLLGALVGSYGARHLLKSSKATQQKVLEGGLLFLGMKAITTVVVPMSDTLKEWLGDDGQIYRPGDYYTANELTYMLGQNGEWIAVDRQLPEADPMMGDVIEKPGPLGDEIEVPGPLGEGWEASGRAGGGF